MLRFVKCWLKTWTAVILLLFCSTGSAWSKLIVFGDSLSDTGNLSSVTTDFPWPYYRNRVSNGPLAVDVLAASLGLSAEASLHLTSQPGGGNFAVDGAKASGNQTEDMVAQVQAFFARHGGAANPDFLYVVMIGGNDLRAARNNTDTSLAEGVVDVAAEAVGEKVALLLSRGARRVLVVNGPDIGRIPETLVRELQEPGIVDRATRLSQRFNEKLALGLDSLVLPADAEIVQFDLFSYFNRLLAEAAVHGFTNTNEGCFDPKRYSFHTDCEWGSRFDRFVFFDNLHPTAKTHRLIGEAMLLALNESRDRIDIAPILILLLQ